MSCGFKFNLQKVLDVRVEKEEESKRMFTKSQQAKALAEENLKNLTDSYDKYKGIGQGESIIYQKVKKNYLFAVEKGISNAEREVKTKSQELELRRRDLLKKQVERKTVDILKEKQLNAFKKEQERLETIVNDEFALYAYIRNAGKEVKW